MGDKMNKLVKGLQEAINDSNKKKTSSYDTIATVVKTDGDILWVHIPGGVDETPVRRTINAKPGDEVQVRVANGSAWALGNATSPPTDDTTANIATQIAVGADAMAESATKSAIAAQENAQRAWDWAENAHTAASEAWEHAEAANDAALDAADAASDAWNHAEDANSAANGALSQLSVVEDVVGTLSWISEHGNYNKTEDTEIDPNKTYFIKINGVYTPVANPEQSQITRYYELSLDDSIQNYISTHLALTDEGLYIVKDDLGYKILLANDGMKVYDDRGVLVSTFGEYVKFSSEKPQFIGSDDAFIIFDPTTKQINIGGNVVIGGDLTIDKFLSEVNSLEVEYTLSNDGSQAFFTASIFRGHDDVTQEFDSRCFTWYYKTEDGEAPINGNNGLNTGYTMTVDINELFEFEGHVITHFTHSYVDYYVENGHAYIKADSVESSDIGEFGFTIDEYGDLIYSYDNTVADFEIVDGRLKALTQYGIFGNKLTRETSVYKRGALTKAFAEVDTTKYITNIGPNGIFISPESQTPDEESPGNSIKIDGTGMEIYNENVPIAKYGKDVSIGNTMGLHIKIDGEELGFYQGENNRVAYIRNDRLFINQSVVVSQMDVGLKQNPAEGEPAGKGQWSWKIHENSEDPPRNNLYLKWIG